jgi:hypothetical protein
MHTKPLADGKPPIDLSVLTKHLVPPQYIGEDEDDVWDIERVILKVMESL